jgi:protein-tyrosine phosphatase
MIDWHCHILPGLDDGAADIEQSLAMAVALAAAGFGTVYCTPHRMPGCYDATNAQVRQGVTELQERLQERGIPLALQPGCEYSLDEYLLASLDDPLPLGDSRRILVEILPRLTADMVRQVLYGVVRRGFTPVIAHPERCQLLAPVVHNSPGNHLLGSIKNLFAGGRRDNGEQAPPDQTGNPLLDYLRELGCSFQGNLGSFKGCYGGRVQSAARALKELNVYDRYGSDLHAPEQARIIFASPLLR